MAIRSIFILNRAGGLVYQKDFRDGLLKLKDSNDYLVIASTFHSLHALTSRISPTGAKSSGIQVLDMPNMSMHCFQTLTGVKFLIVTDPKQTNVAEYYHKVYEIYADYVLKNPFYTLDMPIKCEKFGRNLDQFVAAAI